MAKAFINWYGGKYYMAKNIIEIFPKHKLYCEVFGGAGHVLLRKNPSPIEIYNDINEGLFLLFKILREEDTRSKLIEKIQLTPYSREEFNNSKKWITEKDDLEKVRKFYIRTMQSVGANGGFNYSKSNSRRGMAQCVSRWLGNVDDNLLNAVERLREVLIENLDFKKCIKKYDKKDTLFYLDPPYIQETRKLKHGYDNEMSEEDHKDLVELLLHIKGKVVLSGYNHDIYNKLENNGWNKILLGEYSKRSQNTDKDKLDKGQEFVWINYELE